ncbi:MAG: type III pantothenate kinase [Elusimicrobia bacterium]|nr:type III pantothenate kinase [Elusimicrobiota bacterium]
MLLAVDVGNTNITVGVFAGDRLQRQWRLETDPRRSSEWYGRALKCPFRKLDGSPTRVVVGSVVPGLDAVLSEAITNSFSVKPMFVTPSSPLGLKLKVRTPAQVGADRILNALALRDLTDGPSIAIDFGTATTFDCVDAKGAYVGGAILLGPNSAARALHEFTAKLPLIKVRKPRTVIGKDTEHCLEAGLYFGYLGMIREVLARTKKELGGRPVVAATGGLAPLFLKDLPGVRHEPDLTLNGLRIASGLISAARGA